MVVQYGTSLTTEGITQNKPEKIKVVFDCAVKFQVPSLNDHLLQGPDQLNILMEGLCRFRLELIVII